MRQGAGTAGCGAALLVLLCPQATRSQEPPVLRATEPPPFSGRVLTLDERAPAPRIRLNFRNGATALTDAQGRFVVTGLPPGGHEVTLVTEACRSVTARVRVAEGATPEAELLLPDAMARMDLGPDFEAGEGKLVTAPEIESMRARTVFDVLRRVAPDMVDATPNQPGETQQLRGRNRATLSGRTEPILVLDGLPQGNAAYVLKDLRPDQVAAIQILAGAAGGWVYGASGGMIRIWTKRGRGSGAVGLPGSCPAYEGRRPRGGQEAPNGNLLSVRT